MNKPIILSKPDALMLAQLCITKTDSVLDIGCGINPQAYFKPRVHYCIEPYSEYVEVLKSKYAGSDRLKIISEIAQTAICNFKPLSIDSIFMIDFIEHITKKEGKELINHCTRIAKKQIIIFTPLGFCPQNYKPGDVDGWGYHGGEWQTHKSGWNSTDFQHWNIIISPNFHEQNGKGEIFKSSMAAMWAIKNFSGFNILFKLPTPVIKIITKAFRLRNKVVTWVFR